MIEVAEDMIQDIVEFKVATPAVMQALGQVRVEAGPLYKRGRGRSFFKNGSRKGYSCQGMLIFCSEWVISSDILTAWQPYLEIMPGFVLQSLGALNH